MAHLSKHCKYCKDKLETLLEGEINCKMIFNLKKLTTLELGVMQLTQLN